MLRSIRQVGQVVLLSSGLKLVLLMILHACKVKQPFSLASWYLRGISAYAPEGPPAFVFDIDGVCNIEYYIKWRKPIRNTILAQCVQVCSYKAAPSYWKPKRL